MMMQLLILVLYYAGVVVGLQSCTVKPASAGNEVCGRSSSRNVVSHVATQLVTAGDCAKSMKIPVWCHGFALCWMNQLPFTSVLELEYGILCDKGRLWG